MPLKIQLACNLLIFERVEIFNHIHKNTFLLRLLRPVLCIYGKSVEVMKLYALCLSSCYAPLKRKQERMYSKEKYFNSKTSESILPCCLL